MFVGLYVVQNHVVDSANLIRNSFSKLVSDTFVLFVVAVVVVLLIRILLPNSYFLTIETQTGPQFLLYF